MNRTDSMPTVSMELPDLGTMRRQARQRRLLALQGYCEVEDRDLAGIDFASRIAPAICMTWTAVGTATTSAGLLWALVPFAALGALLPRHPFDLVHDLGRRLMGAPRLPRHGRPRRFACAVAAGWLTTTAAVMQAGATALGTVLGLILVGIASVPVTTGLCLPSWLYHHLFRHR